MGRGPKIRTREDAIKALEKRREYQRQYREKNREKLLEQQRQWIKDHPEKNREAVAKHYAKTKKQYDEIKRAFTDDALEAIDEKLKKEKKQC